MQPKSKSTPSVHIWALLARDAPVGVVFRRGPSRQVQLIKWNLRDDTFEFGQWFKGTIELSLTDLSPEGRLLVYFALKHKGPVKYWTAVSKPPYFTALAMWPGPAITGGGGIFESNSRLRLNLLCVESESVAGTKLGSLQILAPGQRFSEGGQTEEILVRDGWTLLQRGQFHAYGAASPVPGNWPEVWQKPHRISDLRIELQILTRSRWETRIKQFYVANSEGKLIFDTHAEWADWDHDGDLLFARSGKLYRSHIQRQAVCEPRVLIDLTDHRFQNVTPPDWATKW